jgi:AraC-like DNA-binding protein
MVGYAQTNYFIRLFREHTGMTPGEYRRFHASGAAK